jgi:2-methylcitrate dehydratase PrpD
MSALPAAAQTTLPETNLVAHVLAQAAAPVSAATRERLAQALLDWFTAGWSALELPAAQQLRGLATALGPAAGVSAVFGGAPAHAMTAAFANAGITHLREIDDAHRAAMLHPGVVAISPALALAPVLGLTRLQVLRAVVAGYEVSLRVGEALGTRHSATFHATATAGCLGAAASAGVALGLGLGLNSTQLHHALGIAATQAAGLWQLVDDEAHEAKSLHPAFAVRNGLAAAYAAQAGFPGARAFVTGKRGLYAAMHADGPLAALDGELQAPERLHTATIKAWPCCAQLFTALDAMQALMVEAGVQAGDIERVDVRIFPHALKIAGVHWPVKASESPFCLRYLMAVLLKNGSVGVQDTELPELHSPELLALAARIHVSTDDEFQKAYPQRRPSRVTVQLRDGSTRSAYRELRRGDPEDPYTWPALQARMRAFAPGMNDASAAALVQWCEGFMNPALDASSGAPAAALFGGVASTGQALN